jgi:hypothetical protein
MVSRDTGEEALLGQGYGLRQATCVEVKRDSREVEGAVVLDKLDIVATLASLG